MRNSFRKEQIGIVTKDKEQKTIVVEVKKKIIHSLYKKVVKKWYHFHAHDENNEAKIGDKVLIMETRPLSKLKRWRLVQVIEKGID